MPQQGLDDFQVDWEPSHKQTFTTSTSARQAIPSSPIKHFFQWTEIDAQGKVKPIGARFWHLFSRDISLPDDQEWSFERPLGKGSYGAAALFVKVDETQKVVDEFALKVADLNPNSLVHKAKVDLTHEAAIMAQTNDWKTDSIVRLRQFNVSGDYARYYFEFCRYETLETLRLKYKAWNTYLPELFLWHVFSSLAEGCARFGSGPFKNLASSRFGQSMPDGYLLHNDIKTENILLGSNMTKDSQRKWYPIPKFADFGLSIITAPNEALRNQARFLQVGSRAWYPPEQRTSFMQDYRKYYFHQPGTSSTIQRDQHKILAQANLWAVGAVMYSMITMNEIDDLSERVNDLLMGTPLARRTFDGTNIIKRFDPGVTRQYSPELLSLVQACLRIRPQDRPSPQTLRRDAERGLSQCQDRETAQLGTEGRRERLIVACGPGEMGNLPDGGANFEKDETFWRSFAEHLLWIPKDWDVPCPPNPPESLPANPNWPDALRERVQERWAAAVQEQREQAPTTSSQYTHSRKRTASAAFEEIRPPSAADGQDGPSRKRQQIRNKYRRG
ncbi:kinase-like domain-containing protein [Exophiala viscosa]|uniref:non-specific serine/threonine protein kinase n=1 Tax=Exophiala viscosa TaxID=2486360 RepID=A0AAN6DM08_9EURO|nr:kinase-like domain-containing protein [Exophiala viscosa]KAI1620932.1 kinase-like domain-containing protein [Exophiala viscosa]